MSAEPDPQVQALVAFLRQLEGAEQARGWDQPPRLLVIRRLGVNVERLPEGLDVMVGAFEANELPVPWSQFERPPDALEFMATVLPDFPELGEFQAQDIFAWAFLTEGWALSADRRRGFTPAEQRAADTHRIHQHPRRQEVRLVCAVERAGWRIYLQRTRGRARLFQRIDPPGCRPEVTGDGFTGAVPDALAAIMEATT